MDRRSVVKSVTAAALAMRALPGWAQASGKPAPAQLGSLRMVTIPTADLAATEAAYARYFGYRTVWKGTVPGDVARSWQAPAVSGRPALIMEPKSGDPTAFRFVEQPLRPGFKPLTTFGWTAAELQVQDPDALAARLADSPFTIIGAPRPIVSPGSRAMQAVGPSGEVLYFTHFAPNPARPGSVTPQGSFVDHIFVAVAAAPDMRAATDFYLRTFGNASYGEVTLANIIISKANSLPAATLHKLDTVVLPNGRMIEMDQFPATATARPVEPGFLPPGIALATFDYADLDRSDIIWIGTAAATMMPPIAGRATATLRGQGGELVELAQG